MRASCLISAAAFFLTFTVSSVAKGPDLPPAPFKPLPEKTIIQYDDGTETVVDEAEFGIRIRFKNNDGQNKFLARRGVFILEGDWVYSGPTNHAMKARADDDTLNALRFFWPLKVGNEVTVPVTETHARSGEPREWKINLKVTRTEVVTIGGESYATFVILEKAEGDAFYSGAAGMPAATYEATHWYEPGSGLIMKSEVFNESQLGRFDRGANLTSRELKSVRFPSGTTTHALEPLRNTAPAAVASMSVSEAAEDSAAWERIKFSNRVADFQRYMEEHPNGMFTALAENQIRSLLQKQANPKAASQKLAGLDFGNYHALVIGANTYEHLPKLQTAVNDAKAIAAMLERDYGFKVNLILDPKRADILDAFDEYLETLTPKDNLLIYYAGHGWLDQVTDRGYWLPVNARANRRSGWLSNADITDTLKSLKAKHVMVVADSCYSGTLSRAASVGLRDVDYLKRMASKRARVAMVSGGLEPVIDDAGDGHSPFARAFMNALKANADVIDGTRFFAEVRRPVILNADQTPEYSDVRNSGHDGGDFLFVRQ